MSRVVLPGRKGVATDSAWFRVPGAPVAVCQWNGYSARAQAEQLVVMAPQVQLMCIAARGNAEFRGAIKGYMQKVVSDMDKRISTAWFELTANGITPLDTK